MGERFGQKIAEAIDCFLEVLFPQPTGCSACGKSSGSLHSIGLCKKCACSLELLRLEHPVTVDVDGVAFETCIAAFHYDGLARELILALKYKDKRDAAITIGAYLTACAGVQKSRFDFIVPVPVSSKKRSSRGFNHMQLVAAEISKRNGIQVLDCLKRIRDTSPQVLFNRNDRWYNVKGCFRCEANVKGRRLLLVDDIVTTGATAHYCAEALKSCGATEVTLLAFAKSTLK